MKVRPQSIERCFHCKTDVGELGASVDLCLCPMCFEKVRIEPPKTVAIGPQAFAALGGVAIGRNARALGKDALALGDDVEAQAGQRVTGTTLFGIPIEEALYPDGFANVVKKFEEGLQ